MWPVNMPQSRGLDSVAAYAGAALLLAGASFLLYRVRRLESAGGPG